MTSAAAEDRARLKEFIRTHSYRENHEQPFTLASGRRSPYYCDLKKTMFEPVMLRLIIALLREKISNTLGRIPDAVSGLTMGADPLVYGIALAETGATVLPLVVRKQSKDHGSKKRMEGLLEKLRKESIVVLLDDVITTGGSTLQAAEALKEAGLQPRHAFCIVDREEGGAENMMEAGISLHPLFAISEFRGK